MLNFNGVTCGESWFSSAGQDDDVVVSSRVRLARNIVGHPFPPRLDRPGKIAVRKQVEHIIAAVPDVFTFVEIARVSALEAEILVEKRLIDSEFTDSDGALLVRDDESLSVSLFDIDHLRISSIRPGFAVKRCLETAESLDGILDNELQYAVALDLGYLTTEVTNCGTGMRASVLVHLPGLAESSKMEEVSRQFDDSGFRIAPYGPNEHPVLGGMFHLSNSRTIGVGEEEIVEKLEGAAQQLVHYERRARQEMMDTLGSRIEDNVYRAYGILRYARVVSSDEAVRLLSWLRFGAAVGILGGVSLSAVTALLFRTQNAHIRLSCTHGRKTDDDNEIDQHRAELIRSRLESAS
ncbi:MAG: ATP--guanido phosphotransferase [Spirochaetaceae bacterium]|nr:MAG: ATP--guanido phosphotransferase [Spirochaetaceae bacterium]